MIDLELQSISDMLVGQIARDNEAEHMVEWDKPDAINHPEHYCQGGIECIEAIKASMSAEAYRGYLKGNIMKYLWRYEHKGKPAQDIKKMLWYGNRLLGELEGK